MRSHQKLGFLLLAVVLAVSSVARADDSQPAIDAKYAALPNLTDDQKAKIAAIEKQADDQIMALLTDEQKLALNGQSAPAALAPGSGLYANEAAAMTSGPIASRDYWQSKFNAEQLEQAIHDHQPEGAIALQLISAVQLVDDLLKQYPNHKQLHAWHDRFAQVQAQIGDNFDRNAEFKPGCLWNQDSYMQAYVGYNTAKTAMASNDQELAFMMSGLALEKVNYLTESDDHMQDYPENAKAFIRQIKPELNKIHEDSGKATHHL
ncbi:MAG TPA: hypothetical protein VHX86_17320 [Tepidisphaeraceae bacterium]|jgi:hypothetical protein|nr:hypothetical protein [Tepidisphaeraceae bacterium]